MVEILYIFFVLSFCIIDYKFICIYLSQMYLCKKINPLFFLHSSISNVRLPCVIGKHALGRTQYCLPLGIIKEIQAYVIHVSDYHIRTDTVTASRLVYTTSSIARHLFKVFTCLQSFLEQTVEGVRST